MTSKLPTGWPADIDPNTYNSIVELCANAFTDHAANKAVGNFGAFYSFGELDDYANAFASFLQNELNVSKGDRIALMMPNILAYPVALTATLRVGAVVVNINPQYTERELKAQLRDSGARAVIAFKGSFSALLSVVDDTKLEHFVCAELGDFMPYFKRHLMNWLARRRSKTESLPSHVIALREAIMRGRKSDFQNVAINGDDLAFLQYTGGTTGIAKGAMLTHRNIIANILQADACFEGHVDEGKEVVITALPLYHIYALTVNFLGFLSNGSLNYLITDPRNIPLFVKELKRVKFTAITGVNTLFNALMQDEGFAGIDFSTLKFSSGGGMAVQKPVADAWQRRTGQVISEGYGLTEASPIVTINPFGIDEFTGSIGRPVPSTLCRVIDEEGRELPSPQIGELQVKGPQVMQGYWDKPEETRATLSEDGWLSTGDIAKIEDDGFIYIVDRKKDMILVSGFNVYPNEIEEVAVSHPEVVEAAAIGVEDQKSGETVKLLVVANGGTDAEEIIAFCRERLTAYKVPRQVQFVDELPKSNVGKILRREVRELYGGD